MNKEVIKGKNVFFKMITLENIYNGWLDWINNAKLTEYLDTAGAISEESLIDYFNKSQPPRVYMFAIYDNNTEEYIGNARLSSINYDKGEAAYGRLIGNSNYHGRGLGTEVLKLLSMFAFNELGLNKIYTGVNSKNLASIKSNLKAGASLERVETKIDAFGKEHEVTFFAFTNN
jgi:[ribosomal protein S5]-alanine N-acetyltransferase